MLRAMNLRDWRWQVITAVQVANLFAMDKTPRPVCVSRESNSSLNGFPYTDSPPVPVPVGSPPCKCIAAGLCHVSQPASSRYS
jgi:hypothetical protein